MNLVLTETYWKVNQTKFCFLCLFLYKPISSFHPFTLKPPIFK